MYKWLATVFNIWTNVLIQKNQSTTVDFKNSPVYDFYKEPIPSPLGWEKRPIRVLSLFDGIGTGKAFYKNSRLIKIKCIIFIVYVETNFSFYLIWIFFKYYLLQFHWMNLNQNIITLLWKLLNDS